MKVLIVIYCHIIKSQVSCHLGRGSNNAQLSESKKDAVMSNLAVLVVVVDAVGLMGWVWESDLLVGIGIEIKIARCNIVSATVLCDNVTMALK